MEYVEIARAESERGELVLRERRATNAPAVLELRANGVFVMDTLETATEQALAEQTLAQVPQPREVLVGGLGLGFTMHAVLRDSRVERVTVVEIEQALVDWMRDGTVPHGPSMLADERVSIVVADIAVALTEASGASYDLVLLDVDNGPGYLVHEMNASIYHERFLRSAHGTLRPGGALAIWSASPSPDLLATLRSVFAEAHSYSAEVRLQDRDERYWLYIARVTSQP